MERCRSEQKGWISSYNSAILSFSWHSRVWKKKYKYINYIFSYYLLFHSNIIISISRFRNDVLSLESLIARIMLLPKSVPISVPVLKPLWLLFAVSTYLSRTCLLYTIYWLHPISQVTSLSHPHPNLVYNYENAVNRMTSILQHSDISEFYTHHIDLLRYCLECPNISQDLLNQVLNLWLIESDGNIKPLSFSFTKVVRHLLVSGTLIFLCQKKKEREKI